ncbi:MAG: dTDP-4-dehydrorhamnose reductase [Peptostreptococcaceae bacterium]
MNILVTGINGQLGYDVVKELKKRGHNPIGVDRNQMDLTSSKQIKFCIDKYRPDGIIHCAAYTAVDAAEDNKELCREVNSLATKEIAQCAKSLDIPMIYISTDYVFDGNKGIENGNLDKQNYEEYNEEDATNPQNIYGTTKLEGEEYVKQILDKYYIVRISWVFGLNGNNFIKSMLKLSKDREELSIVNDQVGSPTFTKDLAPLLADMIETNKYGIYHATNDGFCTWYEFAKEIFNLSNIDIIVNPISTSEYPTKARRPFNSKMSKEKLVKNGFKQLRHWKEAVKDYIND